MLDQYITALLAHPDGDLWIGYLYGGVSVLQEGRLRHPSCKTPADEARTVRGQQAMSEALTDVVD